MRRREFIAGLGGAAISWPMSARAQQPTMPVIGFLSSASSESYAHLVRAFRQGLSEIGFVEGRNVTIEYRWAEDHYDRLPAMAADLVQRGVNVITANGPAARPAKAATATIPVTFFVGFDPVGGGLVASMNRPGGNVTGVSALTVELVPKRLELLHELLPTAKTLAVLINPTNPNAATQSAELESAAHALGLQLHVLNASSASDIDAAFARVTDKRLGGVIVGADASFNNRSEQIAALCVRHAVPTIFQFREFAVAGGLMSYGGSITDAYRQVGVYTGRILKGEKPADLPVQQAAKVELFVNLKTAKALRLTVPQTLLARADEVIE
jgi:putative ABC transport system substrate-binding protein